MRRNHSWGRISVNPVSGLTGGGSEIALGSAALTQSSQEVRSKQGQHPLVPEFRIVSLTIYTGPEPGMISSEGEFPRCVHHTTKNSVLWVSVFTINSSHPLQGLLPSTSPGSLRCYFEVLEWQAIPSDFRSISPNGTSTTPLTYMKSFCFILECTYFAILLIPAEDIEDTLKNHFKIRPSGNTNPYGVTSQPTTSIYHESPRTEALCFIQS